MISSHHMRIHQLTIILFLQRMPKDINSLFQPSTLLLIYRIKKLYPLCKIMTNQILSKAVALIKNSKIKKE